MARQEHACKGVAKGAKVQRDVVSGSLPLDARKSLTALLSGEGGVKKVVVESARAIARSTMVGEQAFNLSKQTGVQIVAADSPDLFNHTPTPGQAFLRRVMLAVQEYEKDLIVQRLTDGLNSAKKTSSRTTQQGAVKVAGAWSSLEKAKPTPAAMKKIMHINAEVTASQLTQRQARDKLRKLLKISQLGTSTAMRVLAEAALKSKKATKETSRR